MMTTAGVDPNLASNLQLLQKQRLKVEFHLDHTDYKKVENIGTGAYGVVCSAINKKTRQQVAIKKIPNLFTMDPRYAIRTYREIKILQHFKHDNIIAIREILQPVNKDISDIYVVMDLMESDLHKIIYSKQTLRNEHVQYFLYQILRGLKYIHTAHVIHRDLKPSNLLVNADCELKIGDFGMARGINFKAEKSNQQMTQYVATRWYRAPELIVARQYDAAIDIWSVGCIFAEMLNRKHLFPGRDLLNQLKLIFKTLGIPSKQYLQHLDSETFCGFIRKITESEEFKPKTCAELCPTASPDALDLLSKMLVIEPGKRIDVKAALRHPYLSRYHDGTQEPVSSKTFDFAFENELESLENDDQKRVKIQELLRKEVKSYSKPQPIDFGALIPKSAETNQVDGDPYADLNAFLAQLASPVETSNAQPTPSANPLLPSKPNPPANALLAANLSDKKPTAFKSDETNPLLAGATAKQPNSLLDSQATKVTNPLLAQAKDTSKTNPLLLGAVKANPLLESNDVKPAVVETKVEGVEQRPAVVNVSVTTSESDQSNDTELFNSFIKRHSTTETNESLTVNTLVKPVDDIEMISAKLKQTQIVEEQPDVDIKVEDETESKAQDTKSILRQRLIKKRNANAGQLQGQDKPPGKATVTAHQRQKEREERRRKKKAKAQEKNKNKQSDAAGPLLTAEDQRMLDRWRQIAKPKHIQPKPAAPTSPLVSTGGSNVIIVYPAGGATYVTSTVPSTSSVTNSNPPADANPTQVNVCQPNTLLLTQSTVNQSGPSQPVSDQRPVNRPTSNASLPGHQHAPNIQQTKVQASHQSHSNQLHIGPQSVNQSNPVQLQMGQQVVNQSTANQVPVGQPAIHQSTASQLNLSGQQPVNQSTVNKAHVGHQQVHPMTNQPGIDHMPLGHVNHQVHMGLPVNNALGPADANQLPLHQTNSHIHMSQPPSDSMRQQMNHLPHNMGQHAPGVNSFGNEASIQRTNHPIRSFSDIAALHNEQYQDPGQETSLYEFNQPDTDSMYAHTNRPPLPANSTHRTEPFSHWSVGMSVTTSLDIGGLVDNKAEESLPPMLLSTPKGTGGGYGVGFDVESMMAYNTDHQNVHMDSAPLSASLLADWMDVTSNMDPKTLEDIQRELELNDFAFNY